jgi:hypothetical protein
MPDNTESTDWRLWGQERYLQGKVLQYKAYTAPRPSWDHDHCDFCGAKFMELQAEDILNEGYTTEDEYYWICEGCFEDFRELFQWTLK